MGLVVANLAGQLLRYIWRYSIVSCGNVSDCPGGISSTTGGIVPGIVETPLFLSKTLLYNTYVGCAD